MFLLLFSYQDIPNLIAEASSGLVSGEDVEKSEEVDLQLRHRPSASATTDASPSTSLTASSTQPSSSPSDPLPSLPDADARSSVFSSLRGSASNPEFGTSAFPTSTSASAADVAYGMTTSLSESTSFPGSGANVEAIAGRFSKSSVERESILDGRKALLMQQAKRLVEQFQKQF